MRPTTWIPRAALVAAPLLLATFSPVRVAENDISGVVTGPKGPEAGVWVIAETSDLPTKLVKIVVTDDRGRYVLPELPKATYDVWVRGYGRGDAPMRRGRRPVESGASFASPNNDGAFGSRVIAYVVVRSARGRSHARTSGPHDST